MCKGPGAGSWPGEGQAGAAGTLPLVLVVVRSQVAGMRPQRDGTQLDILDGRAEMRSWEGEGRPGRLPACRL